MRKISALFICFVLLALQFVSAQEVLDLSGSWQVKLNENQKLEQKYPDSFSGGGRIDLPASLAEKGFGYKTTGSDFGILTPEYKYVGKAVYTRSIEIPQSWQNKDAELFLERVLWESRVSIDGEELSKQDALGTPHIHKLGKIAPGIHELSIQVDNDMIHNIGDKGHAYGEYTQSIWNGIVGRMEMSSKDLISFQDVKVISDVDNEKVNVSLEIYAEESSAVKVDYEICSASGKKTILTGTLSDNVRRGKTTLGWPVKTEGKLEKWSEFNPEVYLLKLTLLSGEKTDYFETEFGFYEVSHDGTKLLVNGTPVFLRGNLDCVHFPLTGYPSCKVEDWERIFRIYKDYGLNHARFHSWCPPEAAFKAANRVGIYLQAEASIWIDWWMSTDMVVRGRPEMDTKGHPKGLGHDSIRDQFVIAEMNRVVNTYGNHPSFTMFCIGNELGNSDFSIMKKWVADLKRNDPRRLYAVSTAREITDVDDYSATHYIKGIGRTRGLNGATTDWDFEESYAKMNIPIIAHEIGQWPVYPKWSEIEKYKGVLKARNFKEFKEVAKRNGIADQDVEFARASGALNQLMYKYETESFFRTPSCAGVQLLSIQDYQGQGEALIGWLDAHWESKGITTPEEFRKHYNTTVPLLRMEKFVWTNDEPFTAKAQLSHHGEKVLSAKCNWKISNEKGKTIAKGTFKEQEIKPGELVDMGTISFDLSAIKKAQKLNVLIDVDGTEFNNDWDFWVYPAKTETINTDDIYITKKLDEKTQKVLSEGGKVLLIANELGTEQTSVNINFYPLYWSLTFFPGQGKTCAKGTFKEQQIKSGELIDLGTISFDLSVIKKAQKLNVLINVDGTEFNNDWDFWVYPAKTERNNADDIYITKKMDEKTQKVLSEGGKVLLIANELGTEQTSVNINFYPLYWSLTFFPGQGKTCIGMLLKDKHPAFQQFPTSFHSDWQWQTISEKSKGFILNDLPQSYKPIAQPVDDFHRNNKVGAIFECKVESGSLLVCGFNLDETKPVARQLEKSLLAYMKSEDFKPLYELEYEWLKNTMPEIPQAEQADVPDEFENAILYINAGVKTNKEQTNVPWSTELDEVKVAKETTYRLKADGVWKDGNLSAWHGNEMELQINCPDGILGTLYVHFSDSNNKSRTGMLNFEGRKSQLGLHRGNGVWVKFHVMREDSNDGKLILRTKTKTGGNLMITKLALVKE